MDARFTGDGYDRPGVAVQPGRHPEPVADLRSIAGVGAGRRLGNVGFKTPPAPGRLGRGDSGNSRPAARTEGPEWPGTKPLQFVSAASNTLRARAEAGATRGLRRGGGGAPAAG